MSTLEDMQDPSKANLDTKSAARLLPAICDSTFLDYIKFWHTILEEVHLFSNIYIVKKRLEKAITKLKILNEFLVAERSTIIGSAVTFITLTDEEGGKRKQC